MICLKDFLIQYLTISSFVFFNFLNFEHKQSNNFLLNSDPEFQIFYLPFSNSLLFKFKFCRIYSSMLLRIIQNTFHQDRYLHLYFLGALGIILIHLPTIFTQSLRYSLVSCHRPPTQSDAIHDDYQKAYFNSYQGTGKQAWEKQKDYWQTVILGGWRKFHLVSKAENYCFSQDQLNNKSRQSVLFNNFDSCIKIYKQRKQVGFYFFPDQINISFQSIYIFVMNLLTFIKKKQKSGKNNKQDYNKNVFKKSKDCVNQRVDTQAQVITKKQKFNQSDIVPIQEYEFEVKKHKISRKNILKTFIKIKNYLQQQLQNILQNKESQEAWKEHERLLLIKLFRFKVVGKEELLQNYSHIIQACELFYSKLNNNQTVKEFFYVKDQQDFLLFFKHLFGKPYTICNLPSFRKILQILWQRQLFTFLETEKIIENVRHWIHGISVPINPSSIYLNRVVFKSPELIPKYKHFLKNDYIYYDINQSDCLGLTPLLLAVHANLTNAYQILVKCHSNLYTCPLTITKGTKSFTVENKSDRKMTNIQYPTHERKQFNTFQILMQNQQYQQIINFITFSEVRKLKDLKKNKELFEKMVEIPNCYFQIHWKTCKGILTFKQLPKDIITIFKKDGFLRIDYNVDDLEKPSPNGHYSILIKTYKNKKMEFYLINNNKKKIVDLMKEIQPSKLKMRYDNIVKFGNIEQQIISSIKSIYKPKLKSLEANITFTYENVVRAELFNFNKLIDYEKTLISSETLDYSLLDKSEKQSIFTGKIGKLPKIKSKFNKLTTSFKIQFAILEKFNISQIMFILSILDKKSVLFIRLSHIFQKLLTQSSFSQLQGLFPQKINFNIENDFNLQLQIKNIVYSDLDDAVFDLEYKAKELEFEDSSNGLQSLQQTVLLDESYSISVSQFLGKTEKLLEIQNDEVNRKFQELLTRQIDFFYEQQYEK